MPRIPLTQKSSQVATLAEHSPRALGAKHAGSKEGLPTLFGTQGLKMGAVRDRQHLPQLWRKSQAAGPCTPRGGYRRVLELSSSCICGAIGANRNVADDLILMTTVSSLPTQETPGLLSHVLQVTTLPTLFPYRCSLSLPPLLGPCCVTLCMLLTLSEHTWALVPPSLSASIHRTSDLQGVAHPGPLSHWLVYHLPTRLQAPDCAV